MGATQEAHHSPAPRTSLLPVSSASCPHVPCCHQEQVKADTDSHQPDREAYERNHRLQRTSSCTHLNVTPGKRGAVPPRASQHEKSGCGAEPRTARRPASITGQSGDDSHGSGDGRHSRGRNRGNKGLEIAHQNREEIPAPAQHQAGASGFVSAPSWLPVHY